MGFDFSQKRLLSNPNFLVGSPINHYYTSDFTCQHDWVEQAALRWAISLDCQSCKPVLLFTRVPVHANPLYQEWFIDIGCCTYQQVIIWVVRHHFQSYQSLRPSQRLFSHYFWLRSIIWDILAQSEPEFIFTWLASSRSRHVDQLLELIDKEPLFRFFRGWYWFYAQ